MTVVTEEFFFYRAGKHSLWVSERSIQPFNEEE